MWGLLPIFEVDLGRSREYAPMSYIFVEVKLVNTHNVFDLEIMGDQFHRTHVQLAYAQSLFSWEFQPQRAVLW